MFPFIDNLDEFYHAANYAADAELTLPCHGVHVSIQRMQRTRGIIRAHTISPGGKPALQIEVDPVSIPAPGQPLLAYLPGSNAPLRTALFPSRIESHQFTSVMIPSAAWQIGVELDLLGPVGHGFSPPPDSKHWVLIALDLPFDSLLPLVDTAIERDAAIAVYSDGALPDLPAQVEIATTADNLLEWADYIAMAIHSSLIPGISSYLGRKPEITPTAETELLTDLSIPCGLGVCGACGLKTREGWKSACEEGPVYKAKDWVW